MTVTPPEAPTVGSVLEPLLRAVGRDDLVAALVSDVDARAAITASPATRADVTAGVTGVLVDVATGSAELRWCPESGIPWAVTAADDWAQPLVCSCGTASLFLGDAMMSLRMASSGSAGGLLRALGRQCVLTRILGDAGAPPAPAELAEKVAELAARRGLRSEQLRDDLVGFGFSEQRLRDHAAFQLAVDALRREVVADADRQPDGRLTEAWWVRLLARPPEAEVDRLRTLRAHDARVGAEALLIDGSLEGDVVVSRRARFLLPAALRAAEPGATVVAETADGGLFCGGVLVEVEDDTYRPSARTRRRLEHVLFDRWVDARPENDDLQWHWEV